MIRVAVRYENSVDFWNSLPQSLLPEVGRNVHKNVFAAVFYNNRRTCSAVFGIGR
jgi:hypothetical protein